MTRVFLWTRLFIGKITYEAGEPVASRAIEMTSQGAMVNGMDAYKIISAGYTCHISGSKGAYVESLVEKTENLSTKIKDITSGTCVGFRYLQFGLIPPKTVSVGLINFHYYLCRRRRRRNGDYSCAICTI